MLEKNIHLTGGNDTQSISLSKADWLALDGTGRGLVQKYTCSIVTPLENPTEIGTGVVMRIGDYVLIATASHVVETCGTKDIGLIGWYDNDQKRIPVPMGGMRVEGGSDVAFLYMHAEVLKNSNIEGLPLDRLEPMVSHVPGELVLLCGTPAERIKRNKPLTKLDVYYHPIALTTIPPEDWHTLTGAQFDKNKDIVLRYSKDLNLDRNFCQTSPIDPRGMSGCGIWSVPLESHDKVWNPNSAKLIGIQSTMSTEWSWLRGVQIQAWIKLVWDCCPDLHKFITSAFGPKSHQA